jgi:catechol 2,3-dioxygenase-like lactoylglutathione lyase family enzyme
MQHRSPRFAGPSRIHVGLEVAEVERSVAFYRVLFGEEPVKSRPGYAKFEPAHPSVNLSLSEGRGGRAGGSNQHFGVQVHTGAEVLAMLVRFRSAGVETRVESGTECCYALQDKVWARDPDGNDWEVFAVLADSDRRAPEGSTCCAPGLEGAAAPEAASCCGGA